MIVADSLKALELYEKIFDIQRVEVSNLPKGENEVVFTLYGVRFHMLDENPEFGLKHRIVTDLIQFGLTCRFLILKKHFKGDKCGLHRDTAGDRNA